VLLSDGAAKGDDGESGGGDGLIRMVGARRSERSSDRGHRWYGGNISAAPFRHVAILCARLSGSQPKAGTGFIEIAGKKQMDAVQHKAGANCILENALPGWA